MRIKRLAVITAVFIMSGAMRVNAKALDDYKALLDGGSRETRALDADRAAIDAQYDETEKQIKDYQEQISDYEKQIVLYQNQLDRYGYDLTHNELEKRQKTEQEKFLLQKDFYNVCLMQEQLKLIKLELDAANKKIEIEKQRFYLFETTQLALDELDYQKKLITDRKAALENSIEKGKADINTRLGYNADDKPELDFAIPKTADTSVKYDLDELTENCLSSNLSVKRSSEYISLYNALLLGLEGCADSGEPSYATAVSEIKKLEANLEVSVSQIKAYAKTQYNAFLQASASYAAALKHTGILNKQAEILKTTYDNGEMTELDYTYQKYEIEKSRYNIIESRVTYLNQITLLDLLNDGIITE
jgi:outer membrane protein TolC